MANWDLGTGLENALQQQQATSNATVFQDQASTTLTSTGSGLFNQGTSTGGLFNQGLGNQLLGPGKYPPVEQTLDSDRLVDLLKEGKFDQYSAFKDSGLKPHKQKAKTLEDIVNEEISKLRS